MFLQHRKQAQISGPGSVNCNKTLVKPTTTVQVVDIHVKLVHDINVKTVDLIYTEVYTFLDPNINITG